MSHHTILAYAGFRDGTGAVVQRLHASGRFSDLPPCHRLPNHSPIDGFEWGYQGGGPAQLALAILVDQAREQALPRSAALDHYQDFKRQVIANLATDSWTLPASEVHEWLLSALASQHEGDVLHGATLVEGGAA